MSVYDLTLYRNFNVSIFNKFRSCYNKCLEQFFSYGRYNSISGILLSFSCQMLTSTVHNTGVLWCNRIVQWFVAIRAQYAFHVFFVLNSFVATSVWNNLDGSLDGGVAVRSIQTVSDTKVKVVCSYIHLSRHWECKGQKSWIHTLMPLTRWALRFYAILYNAEIHTPSRFMHILYRHIYHQHKRHK